MSDYEVGEMFWDWGGTPLRRLDAAFKNASISNGHKACFKANLKHREK